MPVKELATLTGEHHHLITLSKDLGMPYSALLDALWSSDVTAYRAAALVEAAQQDVAQEFAERKRAREQKHRRRGRR